MWYVWRVAAIAGVLVMATECAPTLRRDRAFTDAWASHQRHVNAYQKPEGKIRLSETTAIQRTEDGETEFRVGRESGFGTDVEIHGGDPEVEVNYKVKW